MSAPQLDGPGFSSVPGPSPGSGPRSDSELVEELTGILDTAVAAGITPGAVARVTAGTLDVTASSGTTAKVDATGLDLPVGQRLPAGPATVYDLASLTKVVTAIAVLALVDAGELDLDRPAATWLPAYPAGTATLRQLLTHTAGLPPVWLGWREQVEDPGDDSARWRARPREQVLAEILAVPPRAAPGTQHDYSCLGYVGAMACAEAATGRPWELLVEQLAIGPLGLGLRYRPAAGATGDEGVAPTELQPQWGRGLVHGAVHDEMAFALHGVSGNAGLFGTVDDVHRLGLAIRDGLPGVVRAPAARLLVTDQLDGLLGAAAAASARAASGHGQAVGLRIAQASFMGEDAQGSVGHTGFTGTSCVIDQPTGAVATLLTNRVHPTRTGPELATTRAAVARLARASVE